MKNIKVTKRGNDYHACLVEQPDIWGCGRSIDEAIGDLIRNHQDTFDITIHEWWFILGICSIMEQGKPVPFLFSD